MIATMILTLALAQDCPNGQCQMLQKPAPAAAVVVSQPVRKMVSKPVKRVRLFGRKLLRGCR
jgi:hypothetical protein